MSRSLRSARTPFTKRAKRLNKSNSSSSNSLGCWSKSKTWRCCQRWGHLRDRRLVDTEVLVGRKERMWRSRESGRGLILSMSMSLSMPMCMSLHRPCPCPCPWLMSCCWGLLWHPARLRSQGRPMERKVAIESAQGVFLVFWILFEIIKIENWFEYELILNLELEFIFKFEFKLN